MNRDVLRLAPELRRRIWGADRLPALLDAEPPPGNEPVGEAWLAYGGSRIVGGRDAGRTFEQVVASDPTAWVGEASLERYGPVVPLLVKFLDAALELSLQVHPDDREARSRHPGSGHLGKTESWRVLDAEPNAVVRWGFRRAVTQDELRAALDDGRVMELVRSLEVHPGDVVHNPAGTVHGLGAGLLVYELQQASDLTYRLWDFQRVGPDGRPRELHVEAALAVSDLSGTGDPIASTPASENGWTVRIVCPFYRLDEVGASESKGDATFAVDGDTAGALHLVTVVDGEAVVRASNGVEARLARGQTLAIPATMGRYALSGRGLVLRASALAPGPSHDGSDTKLDRAHATIPAVNEVSGP